MTPTLATLELTDFLIIAGIAMFFSGRCVLAARRPDTSRRLERKLDAVLKHLGIEPAPGTMLPSGRTMSVEAQDLAKAAQKIAAIRLHREENPGLGLAEAKSDIEDFLANPR